MDIDLSSIPLTPGVYVFKSGRDKIIYVGKAKCLRRRVASYFRANQAALPPKTQALLRQAASLSTLSTTTEKEALLLEAELIKTHRPRYNITLRDDKQYFLFCLDKSHPFPRLAVIRPRPGRADDTPACQAAALGSQAAATAKQHPAVPQEASPPLPATAATASAPAATPPGKTSRSAKHPPATLFGPYASGLAARETWRLLHHIFPLRRCSDRMFKNRVRPCLYYQMKQCLGPCTLPVDREQYARMVEQVELFLNGRSRELLDLLRARMLDASANLDFEHAATLRDRIRDVEKTVEQQVVVSQTDSDLDVLGLAESGDGLGLAVIFVRGGKIMDGRVFFWPGLTLAEGHEALNGFLGQFYSQASLIPARILLPWKLTAAEDLFKDDPEPDATPPAAPDAEQDAAPAAAPAAPPDAPPDAGQTPDQSVDQALEQIPPQPPTPTPAQTLDQTALWEEVLSDLRGGPVRLTLPRDSRTRRLVRMAETNARQSANTAQQTPLAQLLAARLHLAAPPSRIEAVDISHTSGQETRAGLVVFVDGAPHRDEFRAYVIQSDSQRENASGGQRAARPLDSAPGDNPLDPDGGGGVVGYSRNPDDEREIVGHRPNPNDGRGTMGHEPNPAGERGAIGHSRAPQGSSPKTTLLGEASPECPIGHGAEGYAIKAENLKGQCPLGFSSPGSVAPPHPSFAPGDDYAALAAFIRRRLDSGPPWPDLLLIDGGLGQLAVVERALHEAGQDDLFALAAIAKARTEDGRPDRRAGNVADRIFIPGRKNPLPFPEGSPELLFLQRVRDAVHDHALGRHRRARNRAALSSALEGVPGIGPKTAALLWAHFDSLAEMATATEARLAAIPGIGTARARKLKRELARFAGE